MKRGEVIALIVLVVVGAGAVFLASRYKSTTAGAPPPGWKVSSTGIPIPPGYSEGDGGVPVPPGINHDFTPAGSISLTDIGSGITAGYNKIKFW